MARSLLPLFLVSLATCTLGDRSEKEESRASAYPMMQKYMELLHEHVDQFKNELGDLDQKGTAAEHESKRFGEHVDYMNHGLQNFRTQVNTFRQVVAKTAKNQLDETRNVLKNGQYKSQLAASSDRGGEAGIFSGTSSDGSSLLQANAQGSPGGSAKDGKAEEDNAAAERTGEINAAIKILQSVQGHDSSSTHHHKKATAQQQAHAGEPNSTPVNKEHSSTHTDSSDNAPQAQKVHSSGALSKQSNVTAPTEKDQSISHGEAATEKDQSVSNGEAATDKDKIVSQHSPITDHESVPEVHESVPEVHESVPEVHEGAMDVEH